MWGLMKIVSDIFRTDNLTLFVQKAEHLTALNTIWATLMPDLLLVRIANLAGNTLTLQVPNAAWATRVNYASPEILQKLATLSEFNRVQKIKCRIILEPQLETTTVVRAASLSGQELIFQAAQGIDNANLKASLQRLSASVGGQRDEQQ